MASSYAHNHGYLDNHNLGHMYAPQYHGHYQFGYVPNIGYPSHLHVQHQLPPSAQQNMAPHMPSGIPHYAQAHAMPLPPPPPQVKHDVGRISPQTKEHKCTATLWEDEGTMCFQVEAGGIVVARREDNHMINGTKLLNVAKMTRGRRDGLLKGEKVKKVVKNGPMHLKGVWIPFDRAQEFARKENIYESLVPLFSQNLKEVALPPSKQQERKEEAVAPVLPSQNRPSIDRAHTFHTPPANSSYDYPPHAVDSKSLPTTPATEPGEQANGHYYDRNVYTTQSSPYAYKEMGPPAKEAHEERYFPSSSISPNQYTPKSRSSPLGSASTPQSTPQSQSWRYKSGAHMYMTPGYSATPQYSFTTSAKRQRDDDDEFDHDTSTKRRKQ